MRVDEEDGTKGLKMQASFEGQPKNGTMDTVIISSHQLLSKNTGSFILRPDLQNKLRISQHVQRLLQAKFWSPFTCAV